MSPLFVRPSPALRALVDEAGPVSDAVRALLLIGAAAAGLDVRPAEADAGRLLGADLDPRVVAALRRSFFGPQGASTPASGGASDGASTPPEAPLMTVAALDALPREQPADDPFDVGFGFDG